MLANILLPFPKAEDTSQMSRWTLDHDQKHLELIQAITAQKGVTLTRYVLDPYNPKDKEGWELRHQQSHDDINAVLGTSGIDLSSYDQKDEKGRLEWAALHFREHQSFDAALKL